MTEKENYITRQKVEIQKLFKDNKERRLTQEVIAKQTELYITQLDREYKLIEKMYDIIEILSHEDG